MPDQGRAGNRHETDRGVATQLTLAEHNELILAARTSVTPPIDPVAAAARYLHERARRYQECAMERKAEGDLDLWVAFTTIRDEMHAAAAELCRAASEITDG